MQQNCKFDVIIIGSGPGGEGAAMGLVKNGARVAVIERYHLGGGCTNCGTIPSKTLRHLVSRISECNKIFIDNNYGNFSYILNHAENIIIKKSIMHKFFYERNNCQLFIGNAIFININTILVKYIDGTKNIIHADYIIIACGSRPYHPIKVNFNHFRIYDSDSILQLKYAPHHIIIYGAGVIGCEYASIFRSLNVKVDLININNNVLSFLDKDISNAISYNLWKNGVIIRNNEEFNKIKENKDNVLISLKSGKNIKADCLLYTNGRIGNTDSLNLKNIGLKYYPRGLLKVNHIYQTIIPNIYAVGDVIGYPSLASAAYDQGYMVSKIISFGNKNISFIKNIPTGIYTIPEISAIGKTEQDLKKMKVPYEIGRAKFKYLARFQISDMKIGMLKILFHRYTLELLGIHCFGEQTTEIIHIGQAIMEKTNGGNTIKYFLNTTFHYPTMIEAYRVAALDGLNKLF